MEKEKPQGKGRFINLDIFYYEGDYLDGRQHGEGKLVNFNTLEEYTGGFSGGKFHG